MENQNEEAKVVASGERSVAVGNMSGGIINEGTIVLNKDNLTLTRPIDLDTIQIGESQLPDLVEQFTTALDHLPKRLVDIALSSSPMQVGCGKHEAQVRGDLSRFRVGCWNQEAKMTQAMDNEVHRLNLVANEKGRQIDRIRSLRQPQEPKKPHEPSEPNLSICFNEDERRRAMESYS